MSGLDVVLAILLFGAVLMFALSLCQSVPADDGEEPEPWDDPDYEPEWDWPTIFAEADFDAALGEGRR
jgi:hypothetical protein